MLDCKHATRLASQAMDCPLPWRQRIALRLHLLMCDACTQFVRQLHLLRAAVSRLEQRIENEATLVLSKSARKRIADAMHEQDSAQNEARRNPDHLDD